MGRRTEWLHEIGVDGLCFGERLEDLIKSSQKTAKQIAVETGIAPSAISDFINSRDRAPDAKTILVLAQYFNVPTDYLFGLTVADSPKMDMREICEYTGLSSATLAALHKFPYTSLESNFLRRLFEDLLLEAEIAKYVPEAIQRYAIARKTALYERVKLTRGSHETNEPTLSREGSYTISAEDAADMFYGDAVSTAQGNIESVISQMCEEILQSSRIGPPDEEKIVQHRWAIYSEE